MAKLTQPGGCSNNPSSCSNASDSICMPVLIPPNRHLTPVGVNPLVGCCLLGVLLNAREPKPWPDVAPNKRKTLLVGGSFNSPYRDDGFHKNGVLSRLKNVQRLFFATLEGWMDGWTQRGLWTYLSMDCHLIPNLFHLRRWAPVCSDAFRISPHHRCATWCFSNKPPSMWKRSASNGGSVTHNQTLTFSAGLGGPFAFELEILYRKMSHCRLEITSPPSVWRWGDVFCCLKICFISIMDSSSEIEIVLLFIERWKFY